MRRRLLKVFLLGITLLMVPLIVYADIIESDSCGPELNWTVSDQGVLTIKGTGSMEDYKSTSGNRPPWQQDTSDLASIMIEEGDTSVENNALSTDKILFITWSPDSSGVPVRKDKAAGTFTDFGWNTCETSSERAYSAYLEIPSSEHVPGETIEEIIKEPTCTEAGRTDEVIYCTECGTELSRIPKVIDALGHEEVIDEAVAPTCTTTGLTEGKHCSRCNKTLTAQTVVERAAHTPGHPVRENENPSTCQASGSYDEVIYCTVCGNEISRKQIITAPAHTYGDPQYTWSDDNLVCTAVKICTVCHDSNSQIRFVSDHVVFRVDQSPTGNNPGTAICHAVFSDDSITAFKEITIPALNNMTVLYLPSDLEIIEEEAFAGIASEAVIIPDRCREIGQNAFANCENLKYIRIPKSVTLIAENAFVGSNMVMIDQETAPEQEPE